MSRLFDTMRLIVVALALLAAGIGLLAQLHQDYGFLVRSETVTPVTIRELNQLPAPATVIELTGTFRYHNVLAHRLIEKVGNLEVDKGINEYLYPFFDRSTTAGIYVATRLDPAGMATRYGDRECKIRGAWYDFTASEAISILSEQQRAAGGPAAFLAEREAEARRFLDARQKGMPRQSQRSEPTPAGSWEDELAAMGLDSQRSEPTAAGGGALRLISEENPVEYSNIALISILSLGCIAIGLRLLLGWHKERHREN